MSQAGGPNSAGSVNIDFTGNVAPLEQAAKKAEAVVEQSAAKMKATVDATAKQAYMPGENYGPMYNAAAGAAGVAGSSSSRGGFSGLAQGAKAAMAPLNALLSVFTRLVGVFGLASAAGYAIYQMFTFQSRAAAASKKEVEGLRKELESLFTSRAQTGIPLDVQEREEAFAAVQKLRQFDSDNFAKYRAGMIDRQQLNRLEADGRLALADELANIEAKYRAEKNAAEAKSMMDFAKSQREAADERAKYVAETLGGEAEEYIKAQIEIRKAQEIVDADLRDAKIANIERERDEKIKVMADAAKKIADDEIEQARRVDRERRRLMADFYRDLRAQQTQGTEVSGFAAGNLSQSLDLLNRQRSAVEGMSINYGGD